MKAYETFINVQLNSRCPFLMQTNPSYKSFDANFVFYNVKKVASILIRPSCHVFLM